MRPQKSLEGCVFEEDGRRCGKEFVDSEWLYCEEHKESGPKQAKARNNGKYVIKYRAKPEYRFENAMNQLLHRQSLIEDKLRPLVDHTVILQEEYPYKSDLYEDAIREINEIKLLLLYPTTDLPSVFIAARKKADNLYWKLLHDSCPNRVTERLIAYVHEPLRDIGQVISLDTFPIAFKEIGRKARAVREMWRKQGMLPNIILAIFVEVELYRLKFMADPTRIKFWDQAYVRLLAAASVCTRDLYTVEQKKLAVFLDFYAQYGFMRLWLDVDKPERAAERIEVVKQRAESVKQSWGAGPVTQIANYLFSLAQAEYYLHNDADEASKYITQAKQSLGDKRCHLIDEDATIPYLNARLALKRGSPDREGFVHEYVNLCERIPFLNYIYYLRKLKRLYDTDFANISLPQGDSVFVETFFRYISPFLEPDV